jgi:integrase
MRILSTNEIRLYLENILDVALLYNPRIYNSLFIQYVTGCRVGEVNLERWAFTGNNTYLLFTEKNGGTREFLSGELPKYFENFVENKNPEMILNSYSAMNYQFTQARQGQKTYTANKQIKLHLFRHHKARQLSENGQTYTQIKDYLKIDSLNVVANYVQDNIYANF